MEIEVQKLPKALRKKGIEVKLEEICKGSDVIFLEVFGSFLEANKTGKATLIMLKTI